MPDQLIPESVIKIGQNMHSPAAQLLGSTYAGVVETFNSFNACMQMKEDVEKEDIRIGYTNSRFVCDVKRAVEGNIDAREWSFFADMNHSGSVTIADSWLWFKWAFFYPGDFVIKWAVEDMPSTQIRDFFGFSPSWYGGWISGFFTLFLFGSVVGMFSKSDDS